MFKSSWPVSNQLGTSIKEKKISLAVSQCLFQVKADYSQFPLMSAILFMRNDSREVFFNSKQTDCLHVEWLADS